MSKKWRSQRFPISSIQFRTCPNGWQTYKKLLGRRYTGKTIFWNYFVERLTPITVSLSSSMRRKWMISEFRPNSVKNSKNIWSIFEIHLIKWSPLIMIHWICMLIRCQIHSIKVEQRISMRLASKSYISKRKMNL